MTKFNCRFQSYTNYLPRCTYPHFSGTYCHRTDSRPPSCVTPQQPTIHQKMNTGVVRHDWLSILCHHHRHLFTRMQDMLLRSKTGSYRILLSPHSNAELRTGWLIQINLNLNKCLNLNNTYLFLEKDIIKYFQFLF